MSSARLACVAAGVCVLGAGPGFAQGTQILSLNTNSVQGDRSSYLPTLSPDGRWLVFLSDATNLAAGDTNAVTDVFVRDLQTGITERVSVSGSAVQGDAFCTAASISADGRFVAFASNATTLVAGDTNGMSDVFLRDRLLATTERLSVNPAGGQVFNQSFWPSISADGRFVAFYSLASTLVPIDTNGRWDIFVRDRQLGTTELVSVDSGGAQADGDSSYPVISTDGRWVVFRSDATNLVAGDTNLCSDMFVHDRSTGLTERVSVDSSGAQASGASGISVPAVSPDGRFVAFDSSAANLVPGDTNALRDVFLRDRLLGTTARVSVGTGGTQASGVSEFPALSADGHFVLFSSEAANLALGDTNGREDVFVRDLQAGTTIRINLGLGGAQGNWPSWARWISNDGRKIVFDSLASNLAPGDNNSAEDVLLRDRGVPPGTSFCAGDGSSVSCPCANSGSFGRGCENSATTGGAFLTADGSASLMNDTLVLTCTGELPSAPSIFVQGSLAIAGTSFGDGLRCVGGNLKRLYLRAAVGGTVIAPLLWEASISWRSSTLGDMIPPGSTRYYQVYYRDPVASWCPIPPGNNSNISSGLWVLWHP